MLSRIGPFSLTVLRTWDGVASPPPPRRRAHEPPRARSVYRDSQCSWRPSACGIPKHDGDAGARGREKRSKAGSEEGFERGA